MSRVGASGSVTVLLHEGGTVTELAKSLTEVDVVGTTSRQSRTGVANLGLVDVEAALARSPPGAAVAVLAVLELVLTSPSFR